MSVADAHGCAIRADGALFCWGSNGSGQLGRDDDALIGRVGDQRWRAIACGGGEVGQSCGVREDQRLLCWGTNGDAELGNGTIGEGSRVPAPVMLDERVTRVAAGSTAGFAIDELGRLWAWGWNGDARLGFGADVDTLTKPRLLDDERVYAAIDDGSRHGCGIVDDDHQGRCWGEAASGKLGRSSSTAGPLPIEGGAPTWRNLSAGESHTCGVGLDGSLWCWGSNATGQLGVVGSEGGAAPVRIGDGDDWLVAAAGGGHSCAIRSPGALYCWGRNDSGELGVGTTNAKDVPTRVGERDDWVEVHAGAAHTCGRTQDDAVWCWGSNAVGAVGRPGYGEFVSPERLELE